MRSARSIVSTAIGALLLVGCREDAQSPSAPDPVPTEVIKSELNARPLAANTWTARRALSPWRKTMAAATISDIVYVVGGERADGSVLARVDAYNAVSNSWSRKAPLPGARSRPNGASVINGKLYVSGGANTNGMRTKTLYVYDPGTNRWTRKADMPMAGCGGLQGVIGGLLYVYLPPEAENGGCYMLGDVGALFRYDPATDRWVRRASPPAEHKFGVGRVLNGRFHLAGGATTFGCEVNGEPALCETLHKQHNVYNPATNRWTSRAPMSGFRWGMASAGLNGKLFIIGGFGEGSEVDQPTAEVYDPGTNRWSARASLPIRTFGGAAATLRGGILYVSGTIGELTSPLRSEVFFYMP